MIEEKLKRINELTRLSRERELTPEELAEREDLRRDSVAEWRRGAEQVLENTYLVDEKGRKHKLPKKKTGNTR